MASPSDRGFLGDLQGYAEILDGDDNDNPLPQRDQLRIKGHGGALTDDTVAKVTELDLTGLGGGGGAGDDGADGAETWPFTFSTTTTAENPGTGGARLDDTTYPDAANLYVSATNADGGSMQSYFTKLGEIASEPKATVRAFSKSQPERFAVFEIDSVTDNTDWFTLGLTYAGHGDSALLTTAGDLRLTFLRLAEFNELKALLRFTFDDSTDTASNPAAGAFRFDGASASATEEIAISDLTVDDIEVPGLLQVQDAIAIFHSGNAGSLAPWAKFSISAFVDAEGRTRWTVAHLAGEGAFVDGVEYTLEIDSSGSGGGGETIDPAIVDPEPLGVTFAGASERYAREDHAHEHGDLVGGSLHALLSDSAAGFAPSTAGASEGYVLVVQDDGSADWEDYSIPEVSSSGAGLMPSTSGASEGDVAVVQSDGSIDYESAGAPTDHGGLTGLGDDDHTIYLLASGARALAGTWSLGGNALTNVGDLSATISATWYLNGGDLTGVDDIAMAGSNSVITMNGGDISGLDDLTFAGSGSTINQLATLTMMAGGNINANNGSVVNVSDLFFSGPGSVLQFLDELRMLGSGSFIDMNSSDIRAIEVLQLNDVDSHTGPTAGMVEVVGFAGPDTSSPGGMLRHFSSSFLWNFPVDVKIDPSANGGDTLVSVVNFASIAGYNLTDRIIRVRVHLQSTRTDGNDSNYGAQDSEVEFSINTNVSGNAQVGEREMEGTVNASPFDDVVVRKYAAADVSSISTISAVATSGTSVTFTGSIVGSGTRRAMMVVEIKFCYL